MWKHLTKLDCFLLFWKKNPALFLGFSLCSACSLALFGLGKTFLPLSFLLFTTLGDGKRFFLCCVLVFSGFLFISSRVHPLPRENIEGLAEIRLLSVTRGSHKQQAMLKRFWVEDKQRLIGKNVPVTVIFPKGLVGKGPLNPDAGSDWMVTAKVQPKGPGRTYLRVPPTATFWPQKRPLFSFFWLKRAFREKVDLILRKHMRSEQSRDFLFGLLTGSNQNRELADLFQRFSLQHILAISGFHFSVLSTALLLFGQLFFPYRTNLILTLCLLSLYTVAIGPFPSVLRAWMMISFGILSILLGRPTTPLNRLGIAVSCIVLFTPTAVLQVGFWLSVLITASILLFFPLLNRREYELSKLRQVVALSFAVHLTALPLSLYFFHQFPVWGFVYNLFFPFLVTGSIWLVVSGLGLSFLSSVGAHVLLRGAEIYTSFVLSLPDWLPMEWDLWVHVPAVPVLWIQAYLCALFAFGVLWGQRREAVVEQGDWHPLQSLKE